MSAPAPRRKSHALTAQEKEQIREKKRQKTASRRPPTVPSTDLPLEPASDVGPEVPVAEVTPSDVTVRPQPSQVVDLAKSTEADPSGQSAQVAPAQPSSSIRQGPEMPPHLYNLCKWTYKAIPEAKVDVMTKVPALSLLNTLGIFGTKVAFGCQLLREEMTRNKGTISGLEGTLVATKRSLDEATKFGEEAAKALDARDREIALLRAELSNKERAEAELIIQVEELKAAEGTLRSDLAKAQSELEVKVAEADEMFDFGYEKCRMIVQIRHPDLDLSFLDSEAEEEANPSAAEPSANPPL